ncbi:MAG: NAD(P)-dependent oxidoreductase [Bacteriovorax sp.]|jgi:nucleoside-diphosphate-sugar epimerase
MKILVTGANGFVGTHLCQKLLNQGHTVYGLARNPAKVLTTHPKFIIIKGDLNSYPLLWTEFLPADLDACVHTAGLVHSYNSHEFFEVNANGTKALIESLKEKYEQKFKFILISSLASAGPVNFGEIKDVIAPDLPVSDYGRSKKQAENILKQLAPSSWVTSILRPPMIIGPGDAAVLDIFKMVKSRVIILPGVNAKRKEYSFVCVFDLVETITLLLGSDKSLFLYSAHDKTITFLQLINVIKKRMNIRILFYIPVPVMLVHLLSRVLGFVNRIFHHGMRLTPDKIYELNGNAWTCDNKESKTILAQSYVYDLDKTIDVTFEDYKKRNWL